MTARDVIERGARIAGILASGETFSGQEASDSLATFNGILQSWSADGLSVFSQTREEFALVPNQQTYFIGIGSDFNSIPPALISNVGLLIGSGANQIEYPIEIINTDQRADIVNKNLTSTIPQFVFIYKSGEQVKLDFYPIPSTAYSVALYMNKALLAAATLSTTLELPIGYYEALTYAVAMDLSIEYQKPLNEMAIMKANDLKASIMRRNTDPVLMKSDLNEMRPYKNFNILTGE